MNRTTGLILMTAILYLFLPENLNVKINKQHVLIVGGTLSVGSLALGSTRRY